MSSQPHLATFLHLRSVTGRPLSLTALLASSWPILTSTLEPLSPVPATIPPSVGSICSLTVSMARSYHLVALLQVKVSISHISTQVPHNIKSGTEGKARIRDSVCVGHFCHYFLSWMIFCLANFIAQVYIHCHSIPFVWDVRPWS